MHQVGIDEPMLEAQAHDFFDQDLGKGEEKAIEQQPEEKLASLDDEDSLKEPSEMIVDQEKIATEEVEEKDEQAEVAKDPQSEASLAVTHQQQET